MTRALAAIACVVTLGCANPGPYTCVSASQCVTGGEMGVCSAGYCAFADSACPTGFRFGDRAGDGLGGTCTASNDAGMPDAPACGGFGQMCCASEPACEAGASCQSGTCQSCIADVGLGRWFSCILRTDHTVWCAGANNRGQLGFGLAGVSSATLMQVRDSTSMPITDASALSVGREHACVLRTGGAVWCWGYNEHGEVGNGVTVVPTPPTPPPPQPAAVRVVDTTDAPLTGMVEIAAAYEHSCASNAAGAVWCWGRNVSGNLGDGTTTDRSKAAPVLDAPAGSPITGALSLTAGGDTTCIHYANNEVWCWGNNGNGGLGDGTKMNRPNPILTTFTTNFAIGNWYSCYVNADATASCVGASYHGRFGNGVGEGYNGLDFTTAQPMLSSTGGPPLAGIASLATGGSTCARMLDGTVLCTGDNQYGQTGTGTSTRIPQPVVLADGTPLRDVNRLFSAWPHVCARTSNGQYLCWGRNSDGELADGTFMNRGYPAPLQAKCQ